MDLLLQIWNALFPPTADKFAALVGATAIPLWLFGAMFLDNTSSTLSVLAGMFLVGLALAWAGGCLPLLVSAWRAIPRDRFVLLVRLLVPFSFLPLWCWWPGLGGGEQVLRTSSCSRLSAGPRRPDTH